MYVTEAIHLPTSYEKYNHVSCVHLHVYCLMLNTFCGAIHACLYPTFSTLVIGIVSQVSMQ